ncbi:MAG: radical SAM protein [Candidatus Omnitrophota bacterium]|nr:MAG: radical SAM protein [Candidatus Omnitrophota bacterium]
MSPRSRKAAYLQITRECNNECLFCSNPQFKKNYGLGEIKNKIIALKKQNITEIILTGGEPTLVSFLPEVISFIQKNGIASRIITNGCKLEDPRLTKKLFKAGLRDINISIHSDSSSIADKLSQKKGHFKKAIKGLENSLRVGFHVALNSTINTLNCKNLSNTAKFFIKAFPGIKHFVYNNLDPGKADGEINSRVVNNQWIVARYTDIELELKKTVELLRTHERTMRIERVPLCYMQGFEELSSETRKIVKNELYICSFISKKRTDKLRQVKPTKFRIKVECCAHCSANRICAGIQKEYINIYGSKELYPIFCNPDVIIRRIHATR